MKYLKTFENLVTITLENEHAYYLMEDAINKNDIDLIKNLLKSGFDLNYYDDYNDNKRLIFLALKKLDIVKLFIDAGINLNNCKDGNNRSVLHRAFYNDNDYDILELMKLLLDNGADINSLDRNGKPPILVLIASLISTPQYKKKSRLIAELLKRGADTFIKDNSGKDFFDYLMKAHSKNVVEEIKLNLKDSPDALNDFESKILARKYNL